MAQGNTNVQVVTDPANATTVKTAVDAVIAALAANTAVSITALGGGKAILIVGVEGA